MKLKRLLALALSLCMALSLTLANVAYAVEDDSDAASSQPLEIEELDGSDYDVDLTKDMDDSSGLMLDEEIIADSEEVKVIIVMEGDSIIEADSAAVPDSETEAKAEVLEANQAAVVSEIEETVLEGERLEVRYNYTWLLNGVATQVPYGAIKEIEAVDGVKQVLLQPVYSVCETETSGVADPMTITDGVMIGRENTWAEGYTGNGIKIAIIDTGIDVDHQNFAPLGEDSLTVDSATPETVAQALPRLNASGLYPGLTVDDVYYSTKIAYGFNYCDDNLDITHDHDNQGDHGTHVAGIAAANDLGDGGVVGVAPEAQLYVMKVFGQGGGAYTEDILAALEDALRLGADVVNMSLGSPSGFSSDVLDMGDDTYIDINEIYSRASETQTVLSVSAGNAYTAGYSNAWGTDENLTENPDNATVSSPATYTNVLSVASVENNYIHAYYVDVNGQKIGYTEGANGVNEPMLTLADGTGYGIVAVPNSGAPEDYEGLDVTGKIALVQRGAISFADKCQNAESAGAAACLIYNNTSGTISMDLTGCTATIPCASLSMGDGAQILSALEENPALTVTFSDEEASVPSETASQMSDFSSWGVAPDLSLEPDITAPGGNIYSTLNGGSYGLMSGTSMAAPNISGISALVMEYAKEHFGEDVDLRTMVNNLVMSTSAPLPYSDELYYSPRQQGSGMANAYNAVTTRAYLTVEGCDVPKAELRDDPEKAGRYDFTFQVNNFGDSSLYYDLDTTLQTEGVDDAYADYGIYFMSSTPVALSGATSERSSAMVLTHDVDDNTVTNSHDAYLIYQAAVAGHPADENWTDVAFRYNLNGDEASDAADVQAYLDELVGFDVENVDLTATVLQVAAGEQVDVSVSVALDTAAREYIETYYKNGIYVEGFTLLTAKNAGGVDLSLPYLAFYGDWSKADVFDSGYYWQPEEEQVYSQYLNCLFTQFDYYGYEVYPDLGMNPYVEEAIDLSHISLSPNGDGCGDSVADFYAALLRNAAALTVTYTDAETGEVYSEETVQHVSKSTYNANYGQIIPYVYSWDHEPYDLTDEEGNPLPNNTKLLLTISATIDYEGAEPDVWETPITVDTEAPGLLEAKLWKSQSSDEQKLELTFRDNVSVAAVSLLNSAGTKIYGQYAVEDVEPGADGYQTYTATYDVTGCSGKLMIILGDYAFNESSYAVNLGGAGASYGDLVGFQYDEYGVTNSWVSFSDGVNEDEVMLFQTDKEFVCAEYVNGFVFAETKDGKLYGFPYEDMLGDTVELDATYITTLENVYQDMAFNYNDGNLYGLYTSEDYGYASTEVYSINLKGEYYDEDSWTNYEPYQEDWVASRGDLYGLGLACDDEGAMYILGTVIDEETGEESNAQLWKASWETEWGWTSLGAFNCVGDTGFNMNYLQSMTWNHNTEKLYWAQFYPASMLNLESRLIEINPETAEATEVGTLSNETACLFAPLTSAAAAGEAHQNVPEFDREIVGTPVLGKTLLTLNVGGSEQLICSFDPWYSSYTDVTWTTSDETVATVSADGTVTGVAAGSCTVTVASVKDPTLSADCAVTVSALDLSIDGTTCVTGGGVGSVGNALLYHMSMTGGQSAMTLGNAINAPEDLNFGLQLACATLAKGFIWASEFGNTGMVYQIDPATGTVVDALQPIDGDMMYGLAYSENTGLFTGAANTDLYVDLPLTHDVEEEMLNSYDEELREFTWHRLDLSEYLAASDENFNTGESGFGSTVDVVISGITAIDRPYTYEDTYKDYLGAWSYNGSVNYTSDTTYVLLDNVGRLWYVDEICGLTLDEYGDYSNDSAYISSSRNGVLAQDNGDGTYNVFYLRSIEETPLLDMYRSGTMPRYTYHFSDLYYAGQAEDGGDLFFLSLYDYWNEGSSNQFYLYLSGTTTLDEETWEEVTTGRMLYDLGNAGAGNIVTTITSASVTGGLPAGGDDNAQEEVASNGLCIGFYKG